LSVYGRNGSSIGEGIEFIECPDWNK
jgi:hypothetical protein